MHIYMINKNEKMYPPILFVSILKTNLFKIDFFTATNWVQYSRRKSQGWIIPGSA